MALNKFIPRSPDLNIIQDSDAATAKFGHLNTLVDAINSIDTSGGGGIEGTMIATATATGTPEENGISAFNAYKSVRDNSYFLPIPLAAGLDTMGDVASIFWQTGIGEVDGVMRVQFWDLVSIDGEYFSQGKVYALPVGPNKDQFIYGEFFKGAVGGDFFFKYVPMPGELSGRIGGYPFETLLGSTPDLFNFSLSYTTPAQTTNTPIYEVELVRPSVLLPPGEYKWPAMADVGEYTGIDSPVSFVGLDKNTTVLSNSANMIIAYGYAMSAAFLPLTGADIYSYTTPVAQSIIFSNLTYLTPKFSPEVMSATGEIPADRYNAIIFDNCNIKGSIGNYIGVQQFSFIGLFNCDIYPSVIASTMNYESTFYKFEGCNFVGEKGVLGSWGDSTYLAGPMPAMGNRNQFSSWIFNSNAGGKNLWFGNGTDNYVESNRTNFFIVLEGRNSYAYPSVQNPNTWNYTNAEQVTNTGTQVSIVNYSVTNNSPWTA